MKSYLFAILALLILPLPALAGPREDSVSGAMRCASFADDRQWLDCYYGAAQPMRAMLGLPPAAAAQTSLATAGRGAPAPVVGPRNDVLSVSSRCSSFADNRQWLDCYYGAAQPMRARLGLPPAAAAQVSLASVARGAAVTAAAAPAFGTRRKSSGGWFSGWFSSDEPKVPVSEFGERGKAADAMNDQGPVDHVVAHMTAYAIDKYTGAFVVDLDNGQRWKQLSGDTEMAHWGKKASTYTVEITHGWFGSYNMRVYGLGGVYKVDRVH